MNISAETLAIMKAAQSASGSDTALAKSITQATGLVAYDLQAPAKNLYPVQTPLRNRIKRVPGGIGDATNWKVVKALIGSGFDAMPWVPEGQRSAAMSYVTENHAANYVTIGEEDDITFEARNAAQGFEDAYAKMGMRLLQKTMLKEEIAILAGNRSLALGTPTAPTLSAGGTGGTLPGAPTTYSVIVVALTQEGFKNSSLAAGVATSKNVTGKDGNQYTLNGGSSNKSAAATQAITLGQVLSATVPLVTGAVAYAWFVGTAGNEKLEKITTINSATFSAPLAGTGQAATAITADCSRNANLAFDGLLSTNFAAGAAGAAYAKALGVGVAGTGTVLTSSGRGSVNEIDAMLQAVWDSYRTSFDVLFVSSQELTNITNKCLSSGTGPLLNYFAAPTEQAAEYRLTAGGRIDYYFNPYAIEGGKKIPVMIHPDLAPGTIMGYCETLPVQYQSNEVPNVVEMKTRAEYHQIEWPLRTRKYEVGVYAEEVLACYAPFGIGTITNIANG